MEASIGGLGYARTMRPTRPPTLLVAALSIVLVVAACGGASGSDAPTVPAASPLNDRPSVLPRPISSELGVGPNRVVFSFLDASGNRPMAAPDRTVSVTFTGPGGETAGPVEGEFIWAIEDEVGVYAAVVDFPVAGQWQATFTTEAPGTPREVIPFGFDVKPDTSVVRPGERAPSVDTPTSADVGGDLARISTDEEPVPDFYRRSVAEALEAREPFVLVFATPKFCASAQCGPTLDRLKPIAEAHPDVSFINVEPYQLEVTDGQLQPVLSETNQLQPVPAVTEYGLLSEPYVFVVDGEGVVRASFEAIFSAAEIEAALEDLT